MDKNTKCKADLINEIMDEKSLATVNGGGGTSGGGAVKDPRKESERNMAFSSPVLLGTSEVHKINGGGTGGGGQIKDPRNEPDGNMALSSPALLSTSEVNMVNGGGSDGGGQVKDPREKTASAAAFFKQFEGLEGTLTID